MATKRVRFGEVATGSDFEWGGRILRKESELRALTLVPRQDFLFKKSDMVTIKVPDAEPEEDDDLYPMYGLGGTGSAAPNSAQPYSADDLADAYGIPICDGICYNPSFEGWEAGRQMLLFMAKRNAGKSVTFP